MHHYSFNRGTSFIAAMIYDFCAELYGKGTNDHKESEQCWDIFWEIFSQYLIYIWSLITCLGKLWLLGWPSFCECIECCSLDSFGTRVYFAFIFAPPVIPILLPLYMPYMKRLMAFFNKWRMLPKRTKKPFQTSVNHYLKIRVEFYHDVIMWNASRCKRWTNKRVSN